MRDTKSFQFKTKFYIFFDKIVRSKSNTAIICRDTISMESLKVAKKVLPWEKRKQSIKNLLFFAQSKNAIKMNIFFFRMYVKTNK